MVRKIPEMSKQPKKLSTQGVGVLVRKAGHRTNKSTCSDPLQITRGRRSLGMTVDVFCPYPVDSRDNLRELLEAYAAQHGFFCAMRFGYRRGVVFTISEQPQEQADGATS